MQFQARGNGTVAAVKRLAHPGLAMHDVVGPCPVVPADLRDGPSVPGFWHTAIEVHEAPKRATRFYFGV